ncbi:VOC family protein [Primorskyibacter sp. 2E107]|uniref:VOC family protein n=1 Tax=Primorskyibacter sp. 2E107 TaxID=3403458 RepID=UPI003AF622E4
MKINPYLTFDGQAEEAMTFYQSVLGGTLQLMKYGEMPDKSMVPEGMEDRCAHAGLQTDNFWLQASDSMGEPFDGYKGFTIQIDLDDVDRGRALFDALGAGGTVIMPYDKQFWASGFGLVNDRFGVPWMVHVT